jgi:hypothetical protein
MGQTAVYSFSVEGSNSHIFGNVGKPDSYSPMSFKTRKQDQIQDTWNSEGLYSRRYEGRGRQQYFYAHSILVFCFEGTEYSVFAFLT